VKNASVAAAQSRQVRREVTRVLTPGTLLDDGMLNARRNNFGSCVIAGTIGVWHMQIFPLGNFSPPKPVIWAANAIILAALRGAGTNQPQTWVVCDRETSEHLPSCLPTQFCYALDHKLDSLRQKQGLDFCNGLR